MKRFPVLFLISLVGFMPLHSQQIEWEQKGQMIEITYNLESSTPNQAFEVSVFVSQDGGKSFTKNPLTLVTGDVGKGVKVGPNKKILWDVYKEIPNFGGLVVFDIKAIPEVIKEKIPGHFFIGYKGSFSLKSLTAPIGITAGSLGNMGFYFSARLNPNSFRKTAYVIKDDTYPSGWIKSSDGDKFKRISVTAGIQQRLTPSLHVFVGLGITGYTLLSKIRQDVTNKIDWAKNEDESFISYEAEAGLTVQLKKMFVAAGLTNYNKKYADFTLSVGLIL